MRRARPHFSYAQVTSTLALFVALGGGAYAAYELPAGSVDTAQLRQGAVTSAKVRDGSLRAMDFKAGSLPAGPAGPAGPEGPSGLQGIKGDPGGVSGLEVVYAFTGNDSSASKDIEANCPAGKRPTGGGALVTGATSAVPTQSVPGSAPNPLSWYAYAREVVPTDADWTLIVYAMCADATL